MSLQGARRGAIKISIASNNGSRGYDFHMDRSIHNEKTKNVAFIGLRANTSQTKRGPTKAGSVCFHVRVSIEPRAM